MHRLNQKFSNTSGRQVSPYFANAGGGGHGGGGGGWGGHGGGGGHHGGGRWGGRGGYAGYPVYWGYPNYWDYPYYGNYPYYNSDILVVEDGLIKRKRRKTNANSPTTTVSADGGERQMNPNPPKEEADKLKFGKITLATPAMGALGAVAGYFTAQAMGKPPIVGGLIGLAVLGGGTMAYENFGKK